MVAVRKEIFRVIDYPITEDLFKEKIGTGDDLKELIDKGILVPSYDGIIMEGYELSEGPRQEILNKYEEKSELHEKLLEEYYLPIIKETIIIDYLDFKKNYMYFIGSFHHLLAVNKVNEALEVLFLIARKLMIWGKKHILSDLLGAIDKENINELNYLRKLFLDSLLTVFSNSDLSKKEASQLKKSFTMMKQFRKHDILLYMESLNIEAVYYRIFENNPDKAITIHKSIMSTDIPDFIDRNSYHIVMTKNLENLCFCYQKQGDKNDLANLLYEAESHVKETNNIYEIARHHLCKVFIANSYPELQSLINTEEINLLIKDYRFPDIERGLYYFQAKQSIEKKDFENYFYLISCILDRDIILSLEYFYDDFLSMYDKVVKNAKNYTMEILKGLDVVMEYLGNTPLNNEYKFLETLKDFLSGKDIARSKEYFQNNDKTWLALIDNFVHQMERSG